MRPAASRSVLRCTWRDRRALAPRGPRAGGRPAPCPRPRSASLGAQLRAQRRAGRRARPLPGSWAAKGRGQWQVFRPQLPLSAPGAPPSPGISRRGLPSRGPGVRVPPTRTSDARTRGRERPRSRGGPGLAVAVLGSGAPARAAPVTFRDIDFTKSNTAGPRWARRGHCGFFIVFPQRHSMLLARGAFPGGSGPACGLPGRPRAPAPAPPVWPLLTCLPSPAWLGQTVS